MVEFPKIPTRIILTGDRAAAVKLVGLGRKKFSDLTTALGFQGLEFGFNTLKFSDGSEIKTSQSYGVSKIEIFVPEVGGGEEGEEIPCRCCTDCVAVGVLVSNSRPKSDTVGYEYNSAAADVEVCQKVAGGTTYTFYENLTLVGHARPLFVGDSVLVVISPAIRVIGAYYEWPEVGKYPYCTLNTFTMQIFNCMGSGNLQTLIEEVVDLADQSIDTSQYTVTKNSCTALGSEVYIEDPDDYEDPENDCPTRALVPYAVPFNVDCFAV